MDITVSLNQFTDKNCNNAFNDITGTTIGPTVSLCHHCHQHIPAYTYHINNQLWMAKSCRLHGVSYHMIERDYNFINNLQPDNSKFETTAVLFEVSDRCNVDCPHCYHMPDKSVADKPIDQLISEIGKWFVDGTGFVMAGAEASLHKDFVQLVKTIKTVFPTSYDLAILTNGIRFADEEFLLESYSAGLNQICVGLNHPSYLDNATIRKKQIKAITNARDNNIEIGYISYTMASMGELIDILEESTNSGWHPYMYRIRYGSDIGKYPDQPRMYVSDIFKTVQDWCRQKGKSFEMINWDDNIYHVMVKIDDNIFRLIQWCDETDINMEELKTGPYCDFVHDGVTNFLHQIIRRDILKNKGISLPDTPPKRYQFGSNDKGILDFKELYK